MYLISKDRHEVQITYADGIECGDTGDRTSYNVDDHSYESEVPVQGGSSDNESSGGRVTAASTLCWKCHGSKEIECTRCGGSGKTTSFVSSPNYSGSDRTSREVDTTCTKCHGTGKITCTACRGTGTN